MCWKGAKHALRVLKRTGRKKMTLNPHDEFLLALMDYDCADRFDISPTKSSFIFTTWIKLLSKLLKNLVAWLPREPIRDNLPETSVKTGNNKCRVILDCAEVIIDRSKSLNFQAATWCDYKHHDTITYFVGIYEFTLREQLIG